MSADGLEIAPGVTIPLHEVEVRTSRSGGPGGQHANKTESRVEAIFDVRASSALTPAQRERVMARCGPRVSAVAADSRGQARNRALALERLRERLARAIERPKRRRPTRPGRGARERRLEAKRRLSERKRARRKPTDY